MNALFKQKTGSNVTCEVHTFLLRDVLLGGFTHSFRFYWRLRKDTMHSASGLKKDATAT